MKKVIGIMLCLVMLFSIAACAGKSSSGGEPGEVPLGENQQNSAQPSQSGSAAEKSNVDTITVAFPVDPGNLSPYGLFNPFHGFIVFGIYESLFKVNDVTGEIVPNLMERYELSDDGKDYTFYLKHGIGDTNGNEITASDILFSIKLAADSPRAMDTVDIDIDKCEVIDPYTFKWAMKTESVIHPTTIAKIFVISEKSYNDSPDKMLSTPVGTGPYKLESWVQGSSIKLVANDKWWGGDFDIKHVEYKIIGEPSQRTTTLQTGETNFVYDFPISDSDHINSIEGLRTDERDSNAIVAIGFDCSEGSVANDVNFRKAVSLALNNEALTKIAFRDYNTPATTFQSPSVFDYSPDWEGCEYYKYNVDAAKEHLALTDYDGSPLVLVTGVTSGFDLLSEAIQSQLKDIGVNIEIRSMDPATLSTTIMRQPEDWDIFLVENSTFSNYGIDMLHGLHIRGQYPHIYGELFDLIGKYAHTAMTTNDKQVMRENSNKAIWLVQDNCTMRTICYASMKFAYADYLSNINRYSTNKLAWEEVTVIS